MHYYVSSNNHHTLVHKMDNHFHNFKVFKMEFSIGFYFDFSYDLFYQFALKFILKHQFNFYKLDFDYQKMSNYYIALDQNLQILTIKI
jgi:hypothetical protein